MAPAPLSRRLALLSAAGLALAPARAAQPAHKPSGLLVFAAASLTNVLQEISAAFEKRTGITVRLSFAASSALARQIEAGSSAAVFVSADQEWMDYLAARRLIDATSRRDVTGNRLVLIAPADSTVQLTLAPGIDLRPALGDGRLSTADPDTVPAGRYARAALTSLGAWNQVSEKLVRADNVRTALSYVARGEAPLGIVYATDAQIDSKVRVVATFPDSSHDPITYPAAAIAPASPAASDYLEFLGGDAAAAIWRKHGFVELKQ